MTLGDYERRALKEIVTATKKEKKIELINNQIKAGLSIATIGAGVYVGYLGVLAFSAAKDEAEDIAAAIKKTVHDVPIGFFNWVSGTKSHIDPETGIEMIIPKTITDDNGTVIKNNLPIPVVGGINFMIMKFGNLINPIPFFYNPNDDSTDYPIVPSDGTWYGPHVPGHPDHEAWLAGDYIMTELDWYRYNAAEHARILNEEAAARKAELDRLREEQGYEEDFVGPIIDMEKEEEARAEKAAREAAAAAADAERQRYYEEQRAAHAAELAKRK